MWNGLKNEDGEIRLAKPIKDIRQTVNLNGPQLKWYVRNARLGSKDTERYRKQNVNTYRLSKKMWRYIITVICETTYLKRYY